MGAAWAVFLGGVNVVYARFNLTQCPAAWEAQSTRVHSFNVSRFVGTYYEQLLHDYTQYPTCPSVSCIRSKKVLVGSMVTQGNVGSGGEVQVIQDTFTLHCFGQAFDMVYYFNTTATPGALEGYLVDPPQWWIRLFGDKVYPDTIVDFRESSDGDGGQYEWVIEFQCTDTGTSAKVGSGIGDTLERDVRGQGEESRSYVTFTGFNFYTKEQDPSEQVIREMVASARARGLGVYMDIPPGLTTVNQTQCDYSDGGDA